METAIYYSYEANNGGAIQKLWQDIDHTCPAVLRLLSQVFVMENTEILKNALGTNPPISIVQVMRIEMSNCKM